jgi:hypothetical protein
MLPLGGIRSLRFCPYEDVLGAGCAGGVSSLLIPGAGEPNFDSFVANPFQNKKERQEQEVVQLLDKLQPDTIMLEPDAIAKVPQWSGSGEGRSRDSGWACAAVGEQKSHMQLRLVLLPMTIPRCMDGTHEQARFGPQDVPSAQHLGRWGVDSHSLC